MFALATGTLGCRRGLLTKPCLHVMRSKKFISALKDNILPEKSLKPVAYWLFGVGGLVAGMISVGGITRLTRSGLSMTDWKLQGSLPPMSDAEWELEFDRYKQYPEWKQRQNMSISDFKFIYFWEYGHRMMGRGIGLAFALPALYFASRGMIPKYMAGRIAGLFCLGGTQGLIGWWMVKSGLQDRQDFNKEIRVSPYRLATHLGFALATFAGLVWTGLDFLKPQAQLMNIAKSSQAHVIETCSKLRGPAAICVALVGITAVSGAFVAGNDAGRAYNTFPKMGDHWIPPASEMFEKIPIWRNLFESTAMVQFDHRVLAISTVCFISGTAMLAFSRGNFKQLPTGLRHSILGAATAAVAQASLGITTLLTYVPISLAACHQIGSVVLLTTVLSLSHSLRFLRYVNPVGVVKKIF